MRKAAGELDGKELSREDQNPLRDGEGESETTGKAQG